MSGPIVRKYGFPNFDKIFGERPIEHGIDEAEPDAPARKAAGEAKAAKPKNAPAKKAPKKK